MKGSLRHKRIGLIAVLCLVFVQCVDTESKNKEVIPNPLLATPVGFPQVEFPEDNAFSMERYSLGKALFFDPIMSLDSSISCASCHIPEKAFSDVLSVSLGVDGAPGTRNSPSLGNVAYQPYFTREGGVATLEMQILVPIQEHNEFNTNIVLIAEKLQAIPRYVKAAEAAYDRAPDPFVITRAISTFERTLISGNAAFDQYFYQGIDDALSASQKLGMDLFFSEELACASCHGDFNFTNYAFENNGLYLDYADNGRFRITGNEADRARFKVPSLRNVALTAPYMHDGSVATLHEVVAHYQSGGENHPNKSSLIDGFELSPEEVNQLIDFLESLSDYSFVNNPNHKTP